MSDVQPTHLDLFSGIGGFALAARWAGFRTIGFSEIDPCAAGVLSEHWPTVPNLGDVRGVPGASCDLVTGGFPCQPFSVAGKQRGNRDNRHLWPEMLRVIQQSRPSWVLGENVAGIVSMALDGVLSDLEAIGYTCRPFIIPACAVAAPHARNRVWIVAHSAEHGRERLQRGAEAQVSQNRTPETLDAWHGFGGPFEDWKKLLAESHVHRMADGISSTVDVRPRLHAYGNAIVPQLAYQILKAIRGML